MSFADMAAGKKEYLEARSGGEERTSGNPQRPGRTNKKSV